MVMHLQNQTALRALNIGFLACDEHVKNTRVPASLPRLHLYMAGGGHGSRLLLPDHGVSVPLHPLQI